jgi:CHAT domain-containing protein/tetratricopeptide (TPR) repeat protein
MRIKNAFFILFCSIAFSPVLLAQQWENHYQNAQTFLANGDAEKADAEALKCLNAYQQSQGAANATYASILRLLENTSYSTGNFEKGLEYVLKEITIREAKADTILAGAYQQAAQFYQQLNRFSEAVDVLKKSREILLQYFKETEAPVVECNLLLGINFYLNDDDAQAYSVLTDALNPVHASLREESAMGLMYLGMVNIDREKHIDAIRIMQQAKEIYSSLGMTESLENSMVLFNLGLAHHRAKKFADAEKSYAESQTVLEKLEATEEDLYLKVLNERSVNLQALGNVTLAQQLLGKVKNHPGGEIAYAESLSNRASILQNQGNFNQSLELYNEALKLFNQGTKEGQIGYATTLENMALLYSEMGNKEKSIVSITESLTLFDKIFGSSHLLLATAHTKKAVIFFRSFDYNQARADYEKALQIVLSIPSPPQKEQAIALNGMARCYQAIGNFRKADSLYAKALKVYGLEGTGDPNYINTLNGLASSQQDQGKWNDARSLIIRVKNILAKDPNSHPQLLANALENAALINIRLGFTADAKEQLDSALIIVEKNGKESIDYGLVSLSLGKYYQTVGEYTRAELAYRHANETLLKLRGANNVLCGQAQNAMGLLLQTMGNFLGAEPLFQNALRIYEMNYGKSNGEYSTVLQNLATLYQLEEKYDKADPLFKEALEIDRRVLGESHPHFATTQQNLATFYQKTNRQKEALPLLESVLKIIERTTGKNTSSYATAVSNLAAIHQDNNNFDAAEKFWKESVDVRKRVLGESHPDYARSLYGLAALYHATGRLDMAKTYYLPVITSYQKQIKDFFPALSEKEKSAFYNKIRPAFDAYQDFCVEVIFKKPESSKEMIEALYNLQLSTKAILLNASNKVRSRILNGDNQELKDLYSQWLTNKETIVKLVNLSAEERKQQKIDLAGLEQETNQIEKKLSEKSALFSSTFEKEEYTWKDVHQALKPGEAAVEILRIKKKFIKDSLLYAGLMLTADNPLPSMIVWEYGAKMEGRFFRYHRNHIKHLQTDELSYKVFWKPIADKLGGAKVLYLSCDGVFNKVNPGTILNTATDQWVLESTTVKVVSNTRELAEIRHSSGSTKHAGRIFGYPDYNLSQTDAANGKNRALTRFYGFDDGEIPPLPATEKEAQIIKDILTASNWTVSSFIKAEASEEHFKTVDSPGVLHVATHGFFLSDLDVDDELHQDEASVIVKNPLFRSGILLAGVSASRDANSVEDGILTAYEAMNLSLDQTELVALSACETGLGEVRNGEGVYGLQRAFSVAGAKAVLMSLWQVDDKATQELMTTFYSIWLKGTDKHTAFRQAQLELKSKYPQPYYWGAFVLSGH